VSAKADPSWIWGREPAKPTEHLVFRKRFELGAPAGKATLRLSCDNAAEARVNGKPVGQCREWSEPVVLDITKELQQGANVLQIDGRNMGGSAGLLALVEIESAADKKTVVFETGEDWEVSLPGADGFKPARVVGKYGQAPWGTVFAKGFRKSGGGGGAASAAIEVAAIQTPPGFKVELLYTVPKAEQGSWVALAEDDRGRLLAADQYGDLYRVTVPALGTSTGTKVEKMQLPNGNDGHPLGGFHGLLYASGSLYAMVNEQTGTKAAAKSKQTDRGLWRIQDTDGDDVFDKAQLLVPLEGSGEHGPHGLALGPDGKSVYFAAGNHTKLPAKLDHARPVAMGEDHLITRLWDANGHAKGILAPGGYVGKTDLEGRRVEFFAGGFRNQYDIAFDANGELFTYDSDMEWDMGSPWYMPTRINHIVAGGDYGWRSGAGRWPSYYADSLPAAVDIGPGSPTGTVFGTGAKFPAKYQRAFYALDWTYGTMWAIHLKPNGASFVAEKEEFVAGKPMPFTDALIRRADGAMYFTLGGRRSQGALYRVTYAGAESTLSALPEPVTAEAKLRHELEALQEPGVGPEAVSKAWPHLRHADRFVRFAARAAIERQPAGQWAERALGEKDPRAAVEALIALARVGEKALQPRLFEALGRIDFQAQGGALQLPLLRAWELALTRMEKPSPEACAEVLKRLDPLFPAADPMVNRELVSLLVALGSPSVVAKAVSLMGTAADGDQTLASDAVLARNDGYSRAVAGVHGSRPNRQAIAYAYSLREARAGWSPALRKAFFGWFPGTRRWKGGNSFTKFLENIRQEALRNCVVEDGERLALDTHSKQEPPAPPVNLVQPQGPGRNYTVDDVVKLAGAGLKGRDFARGKAMFASTLCINCHHFGGEGGNVGPDLTGSGSRYTLRDLAENILEPSKVISDQYGSEQVELKDGSLVVGRVVVEENGKLFVMTSALAPDALTPVSEGDVKARRPFNVSMMPPGLVNSLNGEELLDLLAYLQSAGKPEDKAFRR